MNEKKYLSENGKRVAAIGQRAIAAGTIDGSNIFHQLQKIPSTNTSGIKGVRYDTQREKWMAQKKIFGKHHAKRFATKKEAIEWYEKIEKWGIDELKKRLKERHKNEQDNKGDVPILRATH